jgi:hypothetical protein
MTAKKNGLRAVPSLIGKVGFTTDSTSPARSWQPEPRTSMSR